MLSPQCTKKLDIRIEEDYIKLSRCCITENINFKIIHFSDILNLSDKDIVHKIIFEYSKLSQAQEVSSKYKCIGTCKSLWEDSIDFVNVSMGLCNFYCSMCRDSFRNYHNIPQIKKIYFKILKAFSQSNIFNLGFTTSGEPFIWKQETFEIIKNSKVPISIVSNLSLLNKQDILELQTSKVPIYFTGSVDSFDFEIYRKIRRPVNKNIFLKVVENVKDLISSTNNNGNIKFMVNMVLTDYNFNINEINNTLLFFKNLNFDYFRYTNDLKKDLNFYNVKWFDKEFQEKCHFLLVS